MGNYFLTPEKYTTKNALNWSLCGEHLKKTTSGNLKGRIIHLLIAALEFPPVISQLFSLAEVAMACLYNKIDHHLSLPFKVSKGEKQKEEPIIQPQPKEKKINNIENCYQKFESSPIPNKMQLKADLTSFIKDEIITEKKSIKDFIDSVLPEIEKIIKIKDLFKSSDEIIELLKKRALFDACQINDTKLFEEFYKKGYDLIPEIKMTDKNFINIVKLLTVIKCDCAKYSNLFLELREKTDKYCELFLKYFDDAINIPSESKLEITKTLEELQEPLTFLDQTEKTWGLKEKVNDLKNKLFNKITPLSEHKNHVNSLHEVITDTYGPLKEFIDIENKKLEEFISCLENIDNLIKNYRDQIKKREQQDLLLQTYLMVGGAYLNKAATLMEPIFENNTLNLSTDKDRAINTDLKKYCEEIFPFFHQTVELKIEMDTSNDDELARTLYAQLNN